MALPTGRSKREYDRFIEVQTGIPAERPGDTFAKKIVEDTGAGVVFVGESLDPAAGEAEAKWRVSRTATSGFKTTTLYAGTGLDDFTQKFSDRNTLFPDVPFANAFSINFNGNSDEYGTVPHSAGITFANNAAFSLGLWFKTKDSSNQTFMQKSTSSAGNNGYTLEMDGNQRISIQHRGGGGADRMEVRADTPTITPNDNQWHLLIATKSAGLSASALNIYLDGVAQTLNTLQDNLTGSTSGTEQLVIGADYNGGTPRFNGFMDEVAIWNAELTASEVLAIYNVNNGATDLSLGAGQISSALVSWWRMGDDASFPTIPDQVGNNDMTLQSSMTSGDLITEVPP